MFIVGLRLLGVLVIDFGEELSILWFIFVVVEQGTRLALTIVRQNVLHVK